MINKNVFSDEVLNKLKLWEKKYPANHRRSVILPALHILQDDNKGYLTSELISSLSCYLSLPEIYIYEVATFYSMFNTKPVGKYQVNVCTNISCMLRGSDKILNYIEKKLGITTGNSSTDGLFTLNSVECLGACCGAPMLEVNKIF